jgi:uncharacterized protein (TIGR02266 family)
MLANLWRRIDPSVLVVNAEPPDPTLDGAVLRQVDIRLLTSLPADGLAVARRVRPSLVIEDLREPRGAGLQFVRDLRADRATRSIPLILVVSSESRAAALLLEPEVLLERPLGRDDLFRALRRFVRLRERRGRRLQTNLRFTFRHDAQCFQAFSRDVSSNGTFLKTDHIPPLATVVELSFHLPGSWAEVHCAGVVRNTTRGDAHTPGTSGIGVEFRGLGENERELLEAFVERQLGRRRG